MSDKPEPASWREWSPAGRWGTEAVPGHFWSDPELLTREEVLATLARWGVKEVSERNLRHWEREGFLPQATIEMVGKKRRAMYPWWSADLVALLRQYQDRRLPPNQVRERLRADAHRLSLFQNARDVRDGTGPLERVLPDGPRRLPPRWEHISDLGLLLKDLVTLHREYLNIPVTTLDIVLTTEAGDRITYNVYPLESDSLEGQ
jgi:hypothetical protein